MVTIVILAALLAIGVGYLAGWRESNRIEAAYELIQGDIEFAAQQARAFSLAPEGLGTAAIPPPQPDTILYSRVVKRELGQPLEMLKEHPIGDGFHCLVAGDMINVDVSGATFQGVAWQIGAKNQLNAASIVFSGTGQPVTLAGSALVAANPPTLTFGTSRRAVEIKISSSGAIQSKTQAINPF